MWFLASPAMTDGTQWKNCGSDRESVSLANALSFHSLKDPLLRLQL